MEIAVSHYTIRSRVDSIGYGLKTCGLEGMVEGHGSVTLDSQSGREELNGQGKMAIFRALILVYAESSPSVNWLS
jgi:hypothetical protein